MYENEHFCKIYVDTEHDKSWLMKAICLHLGAKIDGRTVESDAIVVDVSENEDFDRTKRSSDDDFVFFRYYLDVVPGQLVERSGYIAAVSSILTLLWSKGCRAVAACDFEDELPNRGGYHPDSA